MIVIGANAQELKDAIDKVNKEFDNNIIWNRYDYQGKTRDGLPKFAITLRCKSSKGAGASIGHSGRRLVSACWHVHGKFMDSLPAHVRIKSSWSKELIAPGDRWQDRNIGSIIAPRFASEACNCYS